MRVRVLFATDPLTADPAREHIIGALHRGTLTGPDGRTTTWTPTNTRASEVTPDERDHAARLEADL